VASHNVIYLDVLDLVNDKLLATRKETQRHATVLALAAREHAAIFDAIKAHDTEQARAAMAQHIDSAIWALDQARKRLHQGTGSAFPLEAGSSDSPVGGGGSGASPINGA
jgi:DNA-binding FadR family transcriptional regulator